MLAKAALQRISNLLGGCLLYLDAGAGELIASTVGLRYLLDLGVVHVCSVEASSARCVAETSRSQYIRRNFMRLLLDTSWTMQGCCGLLSAFWTKVVFGGGHLHPAANKGTRLPPEVASGMRIVCDYTYMAIACICASNCLLFLHMLYRLMRRQHHALFFAAIPKLLTLASLTLCWAAMHMQLTLQLCKRSASGLFAFENIEMTKWHAQRNPCSHCSVQIRQQSPLD